MFTPVSKVSEDPMAHRYISYPKDVTNDMTNGHYMIFYVNVQNKAGYQYTQHPDGADQVGGYLEYEVTTREEVHQMVKVGLRKQVFFDYVKQLKAMILHIKMHLIGFHRGGIGSILGTQDVFLTPNSAYANSKYGQAGGINAKFKTTTRITDSVALYLPPNVVRYDIELQVINDNATGIVGLVAAGGGTFLDAMKRNDYATASQSLIGGVKANIRRSLTKEPAVAFVDVP